MNGGSAPEVVTAVYASGRTDTFVPTLRSLARHVGGSIVVGGSEVDLTGLPDGLVAQSLSGVTPAALVNWAWEHYRSDVLFVSDAVVVPPDFLSGARDVLTGDVRAGTISFFSNTAAYLSFPISDKPMLRLAHGHDEVSTTRRLRSLSPVVEPVPIPVAAGACSLFTGGALSAVGPLADGAEGSTAGELAQEFSLLAARRGFIPFLDPSTFFVRPTDLSGEPTHQLESTEAVADWVAARHPYARPLVRAAAAPGSSLGLAMSCARAKVFGLRVLIDGTCFAAAEMGTQVSALALILALAGRDDVAEVQVTLPEGIPPYGAAMTADPKIRVVEPGGATAEIVHRPYQPDPRFAPEQWRSSGARVVVTMLDLIAYQNGSYHEGPGDWFKYRRAIQQVLGSVDAVIAISEDVRRHIQLERLPVEPSRLFVVPIGTDHLSGAEAARMPPELALRGFTGEEFIVTLGANFSHKNRDLTVRAFARLKARRPGLSLVLAGAQVPYGSSRVSEAMVPPVPGVFDLPDMTSEERNWLLRHASAVLYPTSAEGFGLVPFEAARFGTPTVHVGFGSLREFGGEPPVTAADWDPQSLADAVEALMSEPEVARAQVAAVLAAADKHRWEQTAADLVCRYREVLARSPSPRAFERIRAEEVEALQREKTLLEEQLNQIRSTRAYRTASRLWAVRRAFKGRAGTNPSAPPHGAEP